MESLQFYCPLLDVLLSAIGGNDRVSKAENGGNKIIQGILDKFKSLDSLIEFRNCHKTLEKARTEMDLYQNSSVILQSARLSQ